MENYKTKPTAEKLREEITDFIRAQGEPVPGTAPYSQYCVMKLAKENDTTVLLDGQGSDELLAGYHYFYGFYFKGLLRSLYLRKFSSEFYNLIKSRERKIGLYSLIFLFLPSFLRQYYFLRKSNINEKFYKFNDTDYLKSYYSCSNLKEALAFHVNHKLEHLLKWEDRNSMIHSRESRVPFLDHRVVQFLESLPSEYIINKGKSKAILREAMDGILPHEITNRQDKIGFATPEEEWLRSNVFKEFMHPLLVETEPMCKKYVDLKKQEK